MCLKRFVPLDPVITYMAIHHVPCIQKFYQHENFTDSWLPKATAKFNPSKLANLQQLDMCTRA